MKAQEYLDYISESKAKNTAKSYRNALKNFVKWYKDEYTVEVLPGILQERR